MLTLIYALAFTQVLTAIGLIIQGIALLVLQRKIKRLELMGHIIQERKVL